ncbi:putative bifunctional diguanylate cyclase/phosphodiesterase [Chelativorans multitrophicus]|uniref:putative bifunctional diguanylate cyclase/phosphodiesterase n=1 Tax=Chelativorans multitrophicus TaxID=449973 RepID=UPI00140C7864|nr:EAL domain-containing protein [Chelativorans multitrophicus]
MGPSLEALYQVLTAIPYPVFVKDENHRWVLVNQAFCEIMGHTREELLYKTDYDFVPAAQADVFRAIDDHVFATGEPNENEEVLTDASGTVRVITTRKCRVELPTPDGPRPFIVAIFSDITAYREAEARARYHAHHDSLTGLANRMHLGERLQEELIEARAKGTQLALFLLDLDGFKQVNDRYGHAAGDELLQIIATRLKRIVRGRDVMARLGGDEFCVVQVEPDDSSAVDALAERILGVLSEPIVAEWGTARVTASIGISAFPGDAVTQEDLLRYADIALYSVKGSGRASYARYDKQKDGVSNSIGSLAPALEAAIANEEITLAFQPLVSTLDGTPRAFEALARWHHPELGAIPPGVFIPLAERKGLMPALGRLVLRQACDAAAKWDSDLQVRVNISPVQVESGDLVEVIRDVLKETRLPAQRLEIEVTEAVLLNEKSENLHIFHRLKMLGIKIALDDFGSGWTSLDVLRRFPFDRLKIDRSFVANMETDPRAAAVVRAVLSIGKALDLPITAEGVERREQLDVLRTMGCDEVQGHFLGRPKNIRGNGPVDEAEKCAETKEELREANEAGAALG